MSRFHRYSLNNTLLITTCGPTPRLSRASTNGATNLGGVKRGEKGIKIIAPTPFKKIEQEKLDPQTKRF